MGFWAKEMFFYPHPTGIFWASWAKGLKFTFAVQLRWQLPAWKERLPTQGNMPRFNSLMVERFNGYSLNGY
jgi:hypothetical protein